jgi:hypothetical protein
MATCGLGFDNHGNRGGIIRDPYGRNLSPKLKELGEKATTDIKEHDGRPDIWVLQHDGTPLNEQTDGEEYGSLVCRGLRTPDDLLGNKGCKNCIYNAPKIGFRA